MRESLRGRVERAAKRRDVSLNAEAVDRLEQSFAEANLMGGDELHGMARLMAIAFRRGGELGARARKHPEWTPAKWMSDRDCYAPARLRAFPSNSEPCASDAMGIFE